MSAFLLDVDALPRRSFSQAEDEWRELADSARASGAIAITDRDKVQLVVLTADQYQRMAALAGQAPDSVAPSLTALDTRFEARLAALDEPDMGDRLRSLLNAKGRLSKPPVAGESF